MQKDAPEGEQDGAQGSLASRPRGPREHPYPPLDSQRQDPKAYTTQQVGTLKPDTDEFKSQLYNLLHWPVHPFTPY